MCQKIALSQERKWESGLRKAKVSPTESRTVKSKMPIKSKANAHSNPCSFVLKIPNDRLVKKKPPRESNGKLQSSAEAPSSSSDGTF